MIACALTSGLAAELTEAEKQGQSLAADLLADNSFESSTNNCVLRIRDRQRHWTEIPFRLRLVSTSTNRSVIVDPAPATTADQMRALTNGLAGAQATTPIAGSDLWFTDLGLDFLHWPEQRVLKSEMRRGRSCKLLESTNPKPEPGGYKRVLSWIDNEEDCIVQAEAYDEHNKVLKEFEPNVRKVNGRWDLRDIRVRNAQTGTQTLLRFDLDEQ